MNITLEIRNLKISREFIAALLSDRMMQSSVFNEN